MRRRLIIVFLVLVVALALAVPAFAHGAPPCNDSGDPGNSDYAQHHISFLAQNNGMGINGHIPGFHQGFSLCNPSGG